MLDADRNIYFSDQVNCRIRKVTAATGEIATIAGTGACADSGDGVPATSAPLRYPFGVGLDGDGNVLIADLLQARLRSVSAQTGIITTVAGGNGYGTLGDGGLATAAQLYGPAGVTSDGAGNVYIADYYASRVRMIAAGTGHHLDGGGGRNRRIQRGRRASDSRTDVPAIRRGG